MDIFLGLLITNLILLMPFYRNTETKNKLWMHLKKSS